MEFGPCRHLTQPWHCNSPKKKQHDTSQVLRLPRKMTMDTSEVLRLPRKLQRIFWKRRKSIAPATQNESRHVIQNTSECHEVPRLPRKTKQRDMWNLQQRPLCRTYHRHGHTAITRTVADGCGRLRTVGCGRWRTVADGCGRWRTVADGSATSSEHTPRPPDPQSETGTLATHSGKITVRIFQINIVHSDRESSPWPYSRTFWYHGLLGNKMLQECSVFLKEPIPLEYVVFPKSHDHDCKCHTSRSNVCYLHCRIFYVQKTSKKPHADRIWRPRKEHRGAQGFI